VKETVKVNDPELVTAFRGLDQTSADMLTRVLSVRQDLARGRYAVARLHRPQYHPRLHDRLRHTGSAIFSPIDTAKGLLGVTARMPIFLDWLKAVAPTRPWSRSTGNTCRKSLRKLNGETGLMERGWTWSESDRGLPWSRNWQRTPPASARFKKLTGESKAEKSRAPPLPRAEVDA